MKVALLFVTLTCLGLTQAFFIPNVAESTQCQSCKIGIQYMQVAIDFGLLDDETVQQAVVKVCNVIGGPDDNVETCIKVLTQAALKLVEDAKTKTPEEVCTARHFCGDDASK